MTLRAEWQSWDTHVHVFNPPSADVEYIPDAPYSPGVYTVEDLRVASPANHHMIVMALPEGDNPANLLQSLSRSRPDAQLRGTVVLRDIKALDLDTAKDWHARGVRCIRWSNLRRVSNPSQSVDEVQMAACWLQDTAKHLAKFGLAWCLSLQLAPESWAALDSTLRDLRRQHGTVFISDHLFTLRFSDYGSPTHKVLLDLVADGIVHVKISALTRRADSAKGLDSMGPIVQDFLRARDGHGVLWGSDWPHVNVNGGAFDNVDLKGVVQSVWAWAGTDQVRRRIWCDNPGNLFN